MTTLRDEIIEMLYFFAENDIRRYGHVTEGTKESFRVQKVKLPSKYQTQTTNQSKP